MTAPATEHDVVDAADGTPSDGTIPTVTPRAARRRLLRLITDRRRQAVLLVVLAAGATVVRLLGPALVGVVVDAVVDATDGRRSADDAGSVIRWAAIAYAGAALVGALLTWFGSVRAAALGESALAELRTEAFDHALSVDSDRIERGGTGELVARLTGDVNVLAESVQRTVPMLVLSTVELSLTLVAVALVDLRLAAVAVAAGAAPTVLGTRWYVRHAPRRYRRERQAEADLAAVLLEGYDGRATLRAHGAAPAWRADGVGAGRTSVDAQFATAAARNVLRPSVRASLAAALVGVVAVGAALVDADSVSIGAVSAVALYVVRSFDPIGVILEELDTIQQSTAAVARVVGVTRLPVERPVASDGSAPVGSDQAIELRGVGFGYGSAPVVDGIDLAVAPGERLVVVGASGAGKSTLAKLLVGFHQPWHGSISVFGQRTADLRHSDGAHRICLVTQESHVFVRSLADNLRLGRPGVGDAEMHDALRTVAADNWAVALPEGLDTVLDGTVALDAVLRQRIALARLVCAAPEVVVLDEATASLDPIAASRTESALEEALDGRTVITIAHRLDVAVRVDRVVLMDGGRLVADGPHDELLVRSDAYRDLWDRWTAARTRGSST